MVEPTETVKNAGGAEQNNILADKGKLGSGRIPERPRGGARTPGPASRPTDLAKKKSGAFAQSHQAIMGTLGNRGKKKHPRDKWREKLATDVQTFLDNGGEIERLPGFGEPGSTTGNTAGKW